MVLCSVVVLTAKAVISFLNERQQGSQAFDVCRSVSRSGAARCVRRVMVVVVIVLVVASSFVTTMVVLADVLLFEDQCLEHHKAAQSCLAVS